MVATQQSLISDVIDGLVVENTFYYGHDATPYVRFKGQIKPIDSEEFTYYVYEYYRRENDVIPSSQIVDQIVSYCISYAANKGKKGTFSTRIKEQDGSIWINMSRDNKAIEVTKDGWKLREIPEDVFLITHAGQACYPEPVEDGDMTILRQHINYSNEDNWKMIVGFILACFREDQEYPILAVTGTEGSAKTTLTNILMSLLDPTHNTAASMPKTEEDIAVAARARHVVAFDNLSKMTLNTSDSLCKLATGLTINQRARYSDRRINQYTVTRPVILNGIPDLSERGDFVRRSMSIFLEPVKNKSDVRTVRKKFDKDKCRIFGGILDLLVQALKNESKLKITSKFQGYYGLAHWVESSGAFPKGDFMEAYNRISEESTVSVIDSDSLAGYLTEVMPKINYFEGTFDDFRTKCNLIKTPDKEVFPGNCKWFLNKLRRIQNPLERAHIKVNMRTGWRDSVSGRRKFCIRLEGNQ
jgi:hypothetical protein